MILGILPFTTTIHINFREGSLDLCVRPHVFAADLDVVLDEGSATTFPLVLCVGLGIPVLIKPSQTIFLLLMSWIRRVS